MFYHKFKHKPSFATSADVIERFEVALSPTEKKIVDVSEMVYRRFHPVPNLVTDLPSLQAAGINPQLVNVSRLLDPVSPSSMEVIANRVLVDAANHMPIGDESNLESQTT